jgi:protease-4
LVWTGEQALSLGLIDGLGSSSYVARELVGAEKIVDFTPQPTPLEALVGRFGASMGKSLATAFGVSSTPISLK